MTKIEIYLKIFGQILGSTSNETALIKMFYYFYLHCTGALDKYVNIFHIIK